MRAMISMETKGRCMITASQVAKYTAWMLQIADAGPLGPEAIANWIRAFPMDSVIPDRSPKKRCF